jgi:hypothetical protein
MSDAAVHEILQWISDHGVALSILFGLYCVTRPLGWRI